MDIGVQTAALIMRHAKPLTMSSGQLLIPTRTSLHSGCDVSRPSYPGRHDR